MHKKAPLIFGFLLSYPIGASDSLVYTVNSMRAALVGAHTKAFGKNNIFKEPFTDEQRQDWSSVVTEIGHFINSYGDIEQKGMFVICIRANNQMLRFIDKNLFSMQKIIQRTVFSAIIIELEDALNRQKKQKYILESRKLTRTLLEHIAVTLVTTMHKVIRDAYTAVI